MANREILRAARAKDQLYRQLSADQVSRTSNATSTESSAAAPVAILQQQPLPALSGAQMPRGATVSSLNNMGDWPVDVFLANLKAAIESSSSPLQKCCVLLTTGAMNPIHRGACDTCVRSHNTFYFLKLQIEINDTMYTEENIPIGPVIDIGIFF